MTWAACEDDPAAAPACAAEGPFPKRILEPSDSRPDRRRRCSENGVVYFVLSNPDGWHRGEVTEGGVSFQRYNGNGMDLNRDWPTVGYTEAQYTPCERARDARLRDVPRGGPRPRRRRGASPARSTSTAWSPPRRSRSRCSAPASATTARTRSPSTPSITRSATRRSGCRGARSSRRPRSARAIAGAGLRRQRPDVLGPVGHRVGHDQLPGHRFVRRLDGLAASGSTRSASTTRWRCRTSPRTSVFDPDVEQLHIDGNKGLIYAQIASLLFEERRASFTTRRASIGYVRRPAPHDGRWRRGSRRGPCDLPAQARHRAHPGHRPAGASTFDVKGPHDGLLNGGLTIEATFGNVRGISPSAAADAVLEYCGPARAPRRPGGLPRGRPLLQPEPALPPGRRPHRPQRPPPGPVPHPRRRRTRAAHPLPRELQPGTRVSRAATRRPTTSPAWTSSASSTSTSRRQQAAHRAQRRPASCQRRASLGRLRHGRRRRRLHARVQAGSPAATSGAVRRLRRVARRLRPRRRQPGAHRRRAPPGSRSSATGLPPTPIKTGRTSTPAGWTSTTARGETYDRHHLAKGVNKEGTAEGQGDGRRPELRQPAPDLRARADSATTSARAAPERQLHSRPLRLAELDRRPARRGRPPVATPPPGR